MPYNTVKQLAENVKNVLPAHAQDIYKEAFNSAYEEYDTPKERRGNSGREEIAHRVAWSAVKKAGYRKSDDGKWHKAM